MNSSDPVHLPIYTPSGSLPSIRSRTPEEVEQGYRMLREFYAPYKRIDAGADDSARVPNPAPHEKTAGPDSHLCDQEAAGRKDVAAPAVGEPQFTLAELCAIDRQRVERGRT